MTNVTNEDNILDGVKSILAKRDHRQQFLLLPLCLQKLSTADASKRVCMWEIINPFYDTDNF